MKKFAQTAILIAGLVGLSACTHNDVWTPYGDRTAGEGSEVSVASNEDAAAMETLQMCLERENRLLEMNKSCYRK